MAIANLTKELSVRAGRTAIGVAVPLRPGASDLLQRPP